jgi:polysaccharide biosynthesis protein PslH
LKILQLTRKVPWPYVDGESLAVRFMVKGMNKAGVSWDILAMNTTKHQVDREQATGILKADYRDIDFVEIDNRLKLIPLIKNLIANRSYHITRFVSEAYREKLIQKLRDNQPDIVQLESLYLAPYIDTIREYSDAKIVLRAHNIEWQIWERVAESTSNPVKKLYLNIAWKQLKRFETETLRKIDALVPISRLDEAAFNSMGYTGPVFYFPIGIDTRFFDYRLPDFSRPLMLHFIGSLDWIPNIEGITWFVNEIWPKIRTLFPNTGLRIAGRNTPPEIYQLAGNGVEVEGEVADAIAYVQAGQVSIVPLLSGSGMRAKIIEAMALGSIVISTSIGAEGIPATHRESILFADTGQEFADALSFIQRNPDKAAEMSLKARRLVEEHFDVFTFSKGYSTFLLDLKN